VKSTFENIYDTYCPILYSIALQVCDNKATAEKILLKTFRKVYQKKTDWQEQRPFCIDLIKMIIQTAQEELHPGETKCNFKIKQFEKTPLLHKLLVEQLSLEIYCIEKAISRKCAMEEIRNEFMLIVNKYPSNAVDADLSAFHLN
jgi:hypothetical protein